MSSPSGLASPRRLLLPPDGASGSRLPPAQGICCPDPPGWWSPGMEVPGSGWGQQERHPWGLPWSCPARERPGQDRAGAAWDRAAALLLPQAWGLPPRACHACSRFPPAPGVLCRGFSDGGNRRVTRSARPALLGRQEAGDCACKPHRSQLAVGTWTPCVGVCVAGAGPCPRWVALASSPTSWVHPCTHLRPLTGPCSQQRIGPGGTQLPLTPLVVCSWAYSLISQHSRCPCFRGPRGWPV